MIFKDFLPCLEAIAVIAILPLALILLVTYFGQRKRNRLAKWRVIGLTPRNGTWQALWSWDALAGKYRGRSLTMSFSTSEGSPGGATRVCVTLRSPPGSRFTITPKWPSSGLGALLAPPIAGIEDSYTIVSDLPGLAARALAVPRVCAILLSNPKPAIELKEHDLRLERPGYFPDPQQAIDLFDALCELAQVIEQSPNSPGAS